MCSVGGCCPKLRMQFFTFVEVFALYLAVCAFASECSGSTILPRSNALLQQLTDAMDTNENGKIEPRPQSILRFAGPDIVLISCLASRPFRCAHFQRSAARRVACSECRACTVKSARARPRVDSPCTRWKPRNSKCSLHSVANTTEWVRN